MTDIFALPPATTSGTTSEGTAWSRFGALTDQAPIVLIHGVGMQQAYWAPQVNSLSQDYCVVTYDMWGHGSTPANALAVNLADFTHQLVELLDELNTTKAHVVGHSMGALVALDCGIHFPQRTASITLLNAVFDRTEEQRAPVLRRAHDLAENGVMKIDQTLERWFGTPEETPYPQAEALSRRLLESVNPAGYANAYMIFASADDAQKETLASLTIPATFATGDGDPNSTPSMSQAMADIAPHGHAIILHNQRHMMSLTDPETVTDIIRQTVLKADSGGQL